MLARRRQQLSDARHWLIKTKQLVKKKKAKNNNNFPDDSPP